MILVAQNTWRILMDWSTIISAVVGVLAGGWVNAFFSWQGTNEFKQETDNLQRFIVMFMRLLNQANVIPACHRYRRVG